MSQSLKSVLKRAQYVFVYLAALLLLVVAASQLARASTTQPAALSKGEIDRLLSPIALYPDTLLSHILVASTYPIEVVQASHWRAQNKALSAEQALEQASEMDWDPSVQALVPFTDLLALMTDDPFWLTQLGQVFMLDEARVMNRIQRLREQAHTYGNLQSNDYQRVTHTNNYYVIESRDPQLVYVPSYNPLVVYGDWHWHDYAPIVWRLPLHVSWQHGWHWGVRVSVVPHHYYYRNFHWHKRHLVIHHAYRHAPHRYRHRPKVHSHEYQRWQHKPRTSRVHRASDNKVVVNREMVRPGNTRHTSLSKQRVSMHKQHYPKSQAATNAQHRVKHSGTPKAERVITGKVKQREQTMRKQPKTKQRVQQQRVNQADYRRAVNKSSSQPRRYQASQRNSGKPQRATKQHSQRAQSTSKARSHSHNTQQRRQIQRH